MSKIFYPELNAFMKKCISDFNYTTEFDKDFYSEVRIVFPKFNTNKRKATITRKARLCYKNNSYELFSETENYRDMNYVIRFPHWWNSVGVSYNLVIDNDLHKSITHILKERLSEETKKIRQQQSQHDIALVNYLK